MGDLLLSEMVSEVQNNLGNRTDLLDGVRVKRFIKLAERRIAWENFLPEMQCRSIVPSKVSYSYPSQSTYLNQDFRRYLPVGGNAFGGYELGGSSADGMGFNNLFPDNSNYISVSDLVYIFTPVVILNSLAGAAALGATSIILTEDTADKFRRGDDISLTNTLTNHVQYATISSVGVNSISFTPALTLAISPGPTYVQVVQPTSRFLPFPMRSIASFDGTQIGLSNDMPIRYDTIRFKLFEARFVKSILRLEIQSGDSTTVYSPEYINGSEWDAMIAPQIAKAETCNADGPSYYRLVAHEDVDAARPRYRPQVIEVWPPFSGDEITFRAEYVKDISPMVADGNVSELIGKDMAIIAQATHLAFQSFGQADEAARYYNMYVDIMRNVSHTATQQQRSKNPRRRADHVRQASGTPWADPFQK